MFCLFEIKSSILIALATLWCVSAYAGEGRNVNSTPPISVLPFSPALTSQNLELHQGQVVMQVKAHLMTLGYSIGSLDEVMTAKFMAAVYRYQLNRGLEATGRLDQQTILEITGAGHD